ncbi:hypothetical protein SAMN02745227_00835 [Anaerobranca californiensis DSM 14826]|jgi:Cdc6-like AAA superfamily ATPase|uniref:Nephrocystin 3-like N-terminal domain-containing protein n=1 Tax=Anaerobranca californiensis DSM 14826 TaxID=1120989 RepID=A0A1M6MLV0_9FIRM|nr:PRK06851 family protein [Anaerobranca californiensis]SHJ84394.1 hypothetical protein SAMN02745227_00835 [Anaerobranca californiensis DSM 14826]
MTVKIKNIYAGSNTSLGFYSFYDNVLSSLQRIFILKGGPGTGKSTLIKKIAGKLQNEGYNLTYLHCSSDIGSLDGVIVGDNIAIVDGTAPHIIDPKLPAITDEIINLGSFLNREKLLPHKKEISEIKEQISLHYKKAYEFFRKAKEIHDQWEEIYLKEMNFKLADEVAKNLIKFIIGNRKNKDKGLRKDMFFGAITPEGPVNFYDNLIKDITTKFIIKGRPGTGKSTLMKKIAKASLEAGFDTEVFHCAFDPESLDMVIIPKLDVVILDGTAPHVINPAAPMDIVIDMYTLCLPIDIDNRKKEELEAVEKEFNQMIAKGIPHLKEANILHKTMEKYYIGAMDFSKVDEVEKYLLEEIKL